MPPVLLTPTPAAWLAAARRDPVAVLRDHAHCERKAAGQAMALVAAYPRLAWLVSPMVRLAREELRHLAMVLHLLGEADATWEEDAGSPYARGLHRAAGARDVTDRLLVAALIEARSCERLVRLGEAFADRACGRLWAALARSEAGHYRLFLRLASRATPDADARGRRLDVLAGLEAAICEGTVGAPRML